MAALAESRAWARLRSGLSWLALVGVNEAMQLVSATSKTGTLLAVKK
jgi:hypothetical protein